MFYYPTALQRHTGCFTTIWLAATKGIKLSRREFLKVNVKRTCEDIMDYVLVRMPPPQSGLPRPRFSLYLSSQLQYGVVVVYHHQCGLLLDEIQTTLERLNKQKAPKSINLNDKDRPELLLPDALLLLHETEGAKDPLFGVMISGEAVPSPRTLTQMSDRFALSQPSSSPSTRTPSNRTATPESITLRERQPVTIPSAEFEGLELPDHDAGMIEFLLAQDEYFPEGREIELERAEEVAERDRSRETTGFTGPLQPTMIASEDATLLPQEDFSPGPWPPTGEVTPLASARMPSLPGAEELETLIRIRSPTLEVPRKRRARRRGQLLFFDPETQLSQEELQRCIEDPMTETEIIPLAPDPTHRRLSAAYLLTEPCNVLPEAILRLWRQAATLTPLGPDLQAGPRGAGSTDSEIGQEAQRERDTQDIQELQSMEKLRATAHSPTSLSDISGQSIHPLETSDKALSRETTPHVTPEMKGLAGIPEEVDMEVGDPSFSVDLPGLLDDEEESSLLFHSLIPPLADRKAVSSFFWSLLENVAAKKLSVEQDEPYSGITISRGPNYEAPFYFYKTDHPDTA
ncbi:meiotic recombination protein REC8 homolog [Gadus chalcogrammus]|uniref:meiotic recombination protein REC8 homolog n=1 Tax=Gadus chalcogrammus TaxID=1042646 RepID=UPI0024C4A54A|nr:meiotic recombination protein REC8 homolog [Gadus chalcogrammus]